MQPRRPRRFGPIAIAALAGLAVVAGTAAFVRAGFYNVGADDPHYPATHALLEQVRRASIGARASRLDVPADLMSQARITQGAGNYAAMCAQCHLAPGMGPTELSRGLYPAPPDLTRATVDAAEAFWVIKHGIKASGMPAWGGSMADAYIWNMAAFVRTLPSLDAARYRALVDASGGHSHGGGESMPHHGAGTPAAGHGGHPPAPGEHLAPAADAHDSHPHPAGTPDHHAAPTTPPATGHDHAPGTPPHDDTQARAATPAHVDPPGAPPHTH